MRALAKSLIVPCLAALLLAAAVSPAAGREPFFPRAGSHAYHVVSYDVALAYRESGRVHARAKIVLVSRRPLAEVSLDFRGPRVERARIGTAAEHRRRGAKLILTPAEPIPAGEVATVEVVYAGTPPSILDPDLTREGWIPTDDGALAVGEPQGTAAWLPCNNIPGDKAIFRVSLTVPEGLKAVSNGRLETVERQGGKVTFTWREGNPMSPYLAVLDIGRGELHKESVEGLPYWTLMDPRLAPGSRRVVETLPEVIRFEGRLFGGYPFDSAGSIVDSAPGLGYALETQSRPLYAFVPDLTTLVHETAHQWFGDSVGLRRWPNIWLNEGFATWTEWYYAERHGRRSAHAIFNRLYRVPASETEFWNPPSGHPGSPVHMFGKSVYVRGAMALQALRMKIGTKRFLRILSAWATGHYHGSADISQFTALAERLSGRDLGPFFHRWLYRRGKP